MPVGGWLVDGVPGAAVPADDRGLAYGDGLFETVAWRDGAPLRWARHLTRLTAGCRRLGLPPPDPDRLLAEARRVAPARGRAVVKLVLTRGGGGRGYRPPAVPRVRRVVSAHPMPALPAFGAGAAAVFCETRLAASPALAGLKHLGRPEHVLAAAEVARAGAWEGLMRDPDGWVVCGTRTNLFAVRGGVLWTPELSRCGVCGILRAEVLDLARRLAIPIRIGRLGMDDVLGADELFLTNALIGILPVTRLGGGDRPVGPVTRRLAAALAEG